MYQSDNSIHLIYQRMKSYGELPAINSGGEIFTYNAFIELIDKWCNNLEQNCVTSGEVCAVYGDYSAHTCSLFFAMMLKKIIIVPFTSALSSELETLKQIAGVESIYLFKDINNFMFEKFINVPQNGLIEKFREINSSGLVVFSSGSTGTPKGILHDCDKILNKFVQLRQGWTTILFLMMDHFGGFNTILSTFAYGGTAVTIKSRDPEHVLQAIEDSKATLLPTTPTFINLMLASGIFRQFDLSSIKLITYGTEVMPEATLKKVRSVFPNSQIKQTYGLSELGVLRSKSENDSSLWLKIGGEGFEVKVIENILWIRSQSNMVGYLNAPQPFDNEGWMNTGDEVELKGEYIRIIGRKSEIINVGGQKVFPAEVESVLLEASNVKQATVYGVTHPLMGYVVNARISLYQDESPDILSMRLRKFCLEKLSRYKIPVRFVIIDEQYQRNERFKKIRKINDENR